MKGSRTTGKGAAGHFSPFSIRAAYATADIRAVETALADLALLAHERKGRRPGMDQAAERLSRAVEHYVHERQDEYWHLQGLVSPRTARRLHDTCREAWEQDDHEVHGPASMRALERHILEMREELRNGDVIAGFRRDLASLSSGRLRLDTAVMRRPYWRELLRMMRVTAVSHDLLDIERPRWVRRLAQDRKATRECAAAILKLGLFRRQAGRAGDPAAHRFAVEIDHIVQHLGGQPIRRSVNDARKRNGPGLAPGLSLLLATLKPVKPSLTVDGAAELVRSLPRPRTRPR